ncbi:acyl-CoA dehydrogenase [Saccharothrix sp. ALI-22-I]|uniref:acyl-CoA dehydrogenase family protein n=1 Tax=Saccharothrix sp. ALI-22-I TaxID=1933778 RepID=UPI00097C8EBA|nr:acyl-CoA dehydrogenase [Saccharothrix sp. ALI-22-I]ONI91412.1 acyl-CoA dehydrogenase [Saccharothrix sp. ALI-22-I]
MIGTVTDDLVAEWSEFSESALGGLGSADFRTQWKAIAGGGILRTAASDASVGPVTRALAAVEGIGVGGTPAGLCYALASQRFGIQFPLQSFGAPAWTALADGVERGDILLCHALTEEGGGSDPLSMTTRAVPSGDGGWRLNGRKAFVTAAPVADHALVFARTATERTPFALSAFLVDLSTSGVRRSDPFPKVALTGVPMGALDFDDVRLEPERLVGQEGAGLALLTTTTSWERALLLGYALGPMRRVLDRTVDWARSRRQFDRPMGGSHLVAGRIADMALAVHRSRTLVYAMAHRFDRSESARSLASDAALTKISVAQDYLEFSRQAAMLGGVRSFIADTGLTVDLADPMAASVYAGPNDLLRVSVARELGLPVQN